MTDILDDLREKAEKAKLALRKRQKSLYNYAKGKGFTATEATVLQNRSRDYIDRVAEVKEAREQS